MAEILPPSTRPYGYHVFLCVHGDCAPAQTVLPLHQRFMELSRAHGLTKLRNPQRVKCTLADCLGVCAGGPLLVVYPDGVWYHHVDAAALERIFHEHILGGQPVDELIFHRLYPPGREPAYAPEVRGDKPLEEPSEFAALPDEEEPGIPDYSDSAESDTDELEQPDNARHKEKAARRQASYLRKKTSARREKGLIIVHTGPGKGKTTAALGLAFRALGQGLKVGMVQFIKGAIPTGEAALVKQLSLPIEIYTLGDGFTWNTQDREQDIVAARKAWEKALALLRDASFDMVILDELNIVLRYGYLPLAEVLAELRNKRPMLHVVITGRNAHPAVLELADLVTEMKPVKHPYRAGVKAQKGVEF
jgi:cob(I)alamin adenosyltransferase